MSVNMHELIERLDGDQLDRVAALVAAKAVMDHSVPAPNVQRAEYPHELTGVARFILDGSDLFNDDEGDD